MGNLCIYTIFDYDRYPHIPLMTGILKNGEVEFHTLYLKGTKITLYDIEVSKSIITEYIKNYDSIINDFKSHVNAFNLPRDHSYYAYDTHNIIQNKVTTILECKKIIAANLAAMTKIKLDQYRLLLSNAQLVYQSLEDTGVMEGRQERKPIYGLTYAGRSKTSNFNIQGAGDDADIYHMNMDYEYFIQFDWISADLRVASILSGDAKLQSTFRESDPYTEIANELSTPEQEITRTQCKLDMLSGIYSLNFTSPSLEFYPKLNEWLKDTASGMDDRGYTKTILGRRFDLDAEGTNRRSVFNGIFQGSMAHAMHNALYQIYRAFPNNILTETHDAVILASDKGSIQEIIKKVSQIMVTPFKGLIEQDVVFPVRINIGTRWRQWKRYKEIRNGQE